MKKHHFSLLIATTLLFCGFLLGFLVGRNTRSETVFVSVPDEMLTLPAQTTEQEICFPIDLNDAEKEEIMELPGIGEIMTLRILAYRRERGSFRSVEELLKVEGMTENKLKKIQDLVYVGG